MNNSFIVLPVSLFEFNPSATVYENNVPIATKPIHMDKAAAELVSLAREYNITEIKILGKPQKWVKFILNDVIFKENPDINLIII